MRGFSPGVLTPGSRDPLQGGIASPRSVVPEAQSLSWSSTTTHRWLREPLCDARDGRRTSLLRYPQPHFSSTSTILMHLLRARPRRWIYLGVKTPGWVLSSPPASLREALRAGLRDKIRRFPTGPLGSANTLPERPLTVVFQ